MIAGVFLSLFRKITQNVFDEFLWKLSGNIDNDVGNYAHDDVLDSRSKYKGP